MAAATWLAFSRSLMPAFISADPPTAMARLPKVPIPWCTRSVSPWMTCTSSTATPTWSATIWANEVSVPWPWGEMPVSTVTLPLSSTRTVADSQPPQGSSAEGAAPHSST